MKIGAQLIILVVMVSLAFAARGYAQASAEDQPIAVARHLYPVWDTFKTSAEDRLFPLERHQVKIEGEIGRRIDMTIYNHLLVIDAKRFVSSFGPRDNRKYYIAADLLESSQKFALYNYDEKVIALKNWLVREIIAAQLPDGYIGDKPPEKRIVEEWDQCQSEELIDALRNEYRFFGNQAAREAADKLWDYLQKGRAEKGYPNVACGGNGIDYAPIPDLTEVGEHIPFKVVPCIQQLDCYRDQKKEKLLDQSRQVVDFLTKGDGMVITGAVGLNESWHNDQVGRGGLGEACATAFLLRMLESLMRIQGDTLSGDIMERIIYNTLFGAQSPDGRRLHYFTPFEGKRIYFDRDTYCCPGSFRHIMSELPSMAYYRSADGGLAINLYTASKVNFSVAESLPVSLWQETDYPNSGHVSVRFGLPRPASFPVHLRIPRWCTEATVTLNGGPVAERVKVGSFFRIERRWKAGDHLELEMAMKWRFVKGRKRQAGRVAVMRGPMVFCFVPYRTRSFSEIGIPGFGPNVDLTQLLTIEPSSLEGPSKDETVRPGGLACKVRAWAPGRDPSKPLDSQFDLVLLLTEFPDPAGEAVYFKVPDMRVAVDDELYLGNGQ